MLGRIPGATFRSGVVEIFLTEGTVDQANNMYGGTGYRRVQDAASVRRSL